LYIDSEATTNTDDEYLPTWVNRKYAQTERKKFIDADVSLSQIQQRTNRFDFSYSAPQDSIKGIDHMYFPGWTYYSDGVKQILKKDEWGAIAIPLFAGTHQANLVYEPTRVMRFGELVSIASIFALILLIRRRNTKEA
jgi:uncharacterized membrane protein YfhO